MAIYGSERVGERREILIASRTTGFAGSGTTFLFLVVGVGGGGD